MPPAPQLPTPKNANPPHPEMHGGWEGVFSFNTALMFPFHLLSVTWWSPSPPPPFSFHWWVKICAVIWVQKMIVSLQTPIMTPFSSRLPIPSLEGALSSIPWMDHQGGVQPWQVRRWAAWGDKWQTKGRIIHSNHYVYNPIFFSSEVSLKSVMPPSSSIVTRKCLSLSSFQLLRLLSAIQPFSYHWNSSPSNGLLPSLIQ